MHRLPDFLVIGAQKCGTTALIKNISLHPDVHVPYCQRYGEQRPEFHFFNEHWEHGADWYASCFDSDAIAVGEKSPEYLHLSVCHQRMHDTVPDAKLLVIIRDPIDRAYSAFNFARALHPESDWFGPADDLMIGEPISEAFDKLIETQLYTHDCFKFGFYSDQLNNLSQWYRQSQIFITTMEQLKGAPNWVMPQVFEHIGVRPMIRQWVGNDYKATPYPEPMSDQARHILRHHYKESNLQLGQMVSHAAS